LLAFTYIFIFIYTSIYLALPTTYLVSLLAFFSFFRTPVPYDILCELDSFSFFFKGPCELMQIQGAYDVIGELACLLDFFIIF